MAVHLLTGHQSTNHISALDESTANSALYTDQNVIISDSKNVSCSSTISGTTGTITVSSFVALFSGRKVIGTEPTATCTLPDSDTTYKHVSVGILYEKDTSNNDVETCSLIAYTSASTTSNINSAKSMSTGAPATHTIDGDTTEAYFELFDLVVNASGIVTSKTELTYNILPSAASVAVLKPWQSEVNTTLTNHGTRITTIETWKTTAAPQITTNTSDISALKTWKNGLNESAYKLVQVTAPSATGYIGIDYVVARAGYTSYKTMWRDDTAINEYDLYYYKLTVNGAGTSASVQFYKLGLSARISAVSGGSATIIGSVIIGN